MFFFFFRTYKKVDVNCWFCDKNTKVSYKFSNSFICPFCEQYNGFREDGDYNCIIPAQYSESCNFSLRTTSVKDKAKFNNGFCETCNLNQALKIRALSEFSAVSSDDNDEVEKFRERLEEIYGLCQQCQAILHQTLGKQNSWLKPHLISWRLMQSKEKALKTPSFRNYRSSSWKLFHKLSLFVCATLSLLSMEKYSPKLLQPFKTNLESNFMKLDASYLVFLYIGVVLQCVLVLLQKKVFKICNIASFIGWGLLVLVQRCDSFFSSHHFQHLQCFCSFSNLLFFVWNSRIMFSGLKPCSKTRDSAKKMNQSQDISFLTSSVHGSDSLDCNNSFASVSDHYEEQAHVKKKNEQDLDADLLSLKISTPKKMDNRSCGTFSPKNLFKDNSCEKSKRSTCRNVVQPSKFGKHFITQSSWVAGGYWGSPGSPQRGRLTSQNVSHFEEIKPKPVFSQSRSSSQSSGFVSQFSECASSKSHQNIFQNLPKQSHSRHSSLAGDPIDRGSVYSWGRSPVNYAPSLNPLRHQNLDSFEGQSACSASSYLSDNSQLYLPTSTQSGSYLHSSPPTLINDILPLDKVDRFSSITCKSNLVPSYFNLGIAFVLGLSVSANIFLIIILSQYNIL